MILKNNYFFYEKILSKKFCNDIINFALSDKKEIIDGITGDSKNISLEEVKKIRDCNIRWLDEPWISNQITPIVMDANKKAGWNFQFTQYEKAQFTIYDNSQFYNWHTDASANTKDDGSHRKLSVTLSLNDEDEFEGGCFEIDNRNNYYEKNIHQLNNIRSAGSLVVFPSFLYHRVTPVTKGTRYSLVMWYSGRPYI